MKSPQKYSWVELPFGRFMVIKGPSQEDPYVWLDDKRGNQLSIHRNSLYQMFHEVEFGT